MEIYDNSRLIHGNSRHENKNITLSLHVNVRKCHVNFFVNASMEIYDNSRLIHGNSRHENKNITLSLHVDVRKCHVNFFVNASMEIYDNSRLITSLQSVGPRTNLTEIRVQKNNINLFVNLCFFLNCCNYL